MKKHVSHFSTYLSTLLKTPFSYGQWMIAVMCLIIGRVWIEYALSNLPHASARIFFLFSAHFFLSLLCTLLLFLPLVVWRARVSVQEAAGVLIFGFLVVLTPPLIDTIVAQGGHFWNFYKFDGLSGWENGKGLLWRFFTFFGDRPDIGVTYGVRVEILLSSIFFSSYVFLKTRHWLRAFGTFFLAYGVFFFLGTLPSWLTLFWEGWFQPLTSITDITVAQLFFTPEPLFGQSPPSLEGTLSIKMSLVYTLFVVGLVMLEVRYFFPRLWRALVGNARFPQLFYHSGLACVGMGLAVMVTGAPLPLTLFNVLAFCVLHIALWCAWLATVVANDCVDIHIDRQTNAFRPLPSQTISPKLYRSIGWTFFWMSILLASLLGFSVVFFFLAYHMLAWVYSVPPLRLKRLPLLATGIAALSSLCIVYAGFTLVAGGESLQAFPRIIAFFLLGAFTLILPVKDFKDRVGDASDGVYTLPVLLGEEWAKRVIGGSLWLVYMASLFLFHDARLFLPSLLAGGLSFLMVMLASDRSGARISFRALPGWIFSVACVYGCILAFFIVRL
jgi:4-hydroxybenzoate polyprenyltransferase